MSLNLIVTVGILLLFSVFFLIVQPSSPVINQGGGQVEFRKTGSSSHQSTIRYNPKNGPINQTSATKVKNGRQSMIKPGLKNDLQQGLLESGQFDLLVENLDLLQLMTKLEFTRSLPTGRDDSAPELFDFEVEMPKYFKYIINQLFDFTRAIYQLYEKKFKTDGEIIYPNLPASSRQQLAENEYYVLKYFQELLQPVKTLNGINSYQMDFFHYGEGKSLRKALFLLYGKLLPYLDTEYSMSVTGGTQYELMPEIGPEYVDEKWSELLSLMSKINGRFYGLISQLQNEVKRHESNDMMDFGLLAGK